MTLRLNETVLSLIKRKQHPWSSESGQVHFREQVLRKRSYLRMEWCELALAHPARVERQADGRMRYWVYIGELQRYLRVVTLEDGETVLNAFPDRSFKEQGS